MNRWIDPAQGVMNIVAGQGVFHVVLSVTPAFDSEEPLFEGHIFNCVIGWPTLVHQCDYHDARVQWSMIPVA
jgi:hypothetical protein